MATTSSSTLNFLHDEVTGSAVSLATIASARAEFRSLRDRAAWEHDRDRFDGTTLFSFQ